jgi:hypothetical protein
MPLSLYWMSFDRKLEQAKRGITSISKTEILLKIARCLDSVFDRSIQLFLNHSIPSGG